MKQKQNIVQENLKYEYPKIHQNCKRCKLKFIIKFSFQFENAFDGYFEVLIQYKYAFANYPFPIKLLSNLCLYFVSTFTKQIKKIFLDN